MEQSISYPKYVNPMIDAKALLGAKNYNDLLCKARELAIDHVRAKGLTGYYAEQYVKGFIEGFVEGYVEYLVYAVKALLAYGMAPELVAKYTQLSIEAILAL